jgi:putative salt-induced outer membrane protein YdiY
VVLALATVAAAEEQEEEPPLWTGSLGLSLVATGGNSDTSTLGAELQLERRPQPWGLRLGASFTRAETDGTLTAERYAANLRGERKPADRWSLFAGAGGERDQLAGLDLRTVVETGVTFTALPASQGSHPSQPHNATQAPCLQ